MQYHSAAAHSVQEMLFLEMSPMMSEDNSVVLNYSSWLEI